MEDDEPDTDLPEDDEGMHERLLSHDSAEGFHRHERFAHTERLALQGRHMHHPCVNDCRKVKYDEKEMVRDAGLLGFICKYCGDGFITELTMKSHYRKCLQVISLEGENGKLCQLCMEIKDKVAFSRNMRNKDALDTYCRDCNKVKTKRRKNIGKKIFFNLPN